MLWESLDPKVPRGPVSFGRLDIDAFGNLQSPARFPVWVENGGGTPFSLTVEAANIMVTMPGTGSAPMDDALRILFGPAGGDLRPAPDHAVMIDPTTPPPPLEGVGFVGQGPNGEPSDFGPADAAPGVIAVAANGERIAVVGDNIGDTFTVVLQGNPISTVGGQNFTPLTDRDGSGTVTTADLEIVIPVVAAGDLRPGETAIAAGDINITSILSAERGIVAFQVVAQGLQAANAVFDLRYATPLATGASASGAGGNSIFAGELSLEFLKTPEELGGTDTQISFDIVFKAEGQSVPQSNGGIPDLVIDLTAEVVQWEVLDGQSIEVWGYNGQYPGPEIRLKVGQRLQVNFTNNLPEPTTIHWHGQDVPNDQDGVPGITQPDIPPGGTWTYEFVLPRPSTGMHHTHSNVASQLAKGLFGAFIVEPAEGLPQYDREYTMLMHEIQGYYTINGHSFPKTLEDSLMKIRTGERILIRLANPGRQHHPMHLHGQQFKVVGVDGSPLPFPLLQNTFDLAPGQTADIEVEGANPGTWGFHCHVPTHVTNFGSYPGGMITMLDYAGIPQIKPTFLDIAPSGIPSNIIPHSKGGKCGLIRSNSPFSYSNHRPAKPKIPKPLVYAQVSPLGTSFATP